MFSMGEYTPIFAEQAKTIAAYLATEPTVKNTEHEFESEHYGGKQARAIIAALSRGDKNQKAQQLRRLANTAEELRRKYSNETFVTEDRAKLAAARVGKYLNKQEGTVVGLGTSSQRYEADVLHCVSALLGSSVKEQRANSLTLLNTIENLTEAAFYDKPSPWSLNMRRASKVMRFFMDDLAGADPQDFQSKLYALNQMLQKIAGTVNPKRALQLIAVAAKQAKDRPLLLKKMQNDEQKAALLKAYFKEYMKSSFIDACQSGHIMNSQLIKRDGGTIVILPNHPEITCDDTIQYQINLVHKGNKFRLSLEGSDDGLSRVWIDFTKSNLDGDDKLDYFSGMNRFKVSRAYDRELINATDKLWKRLGDIKEHQGLLELDLLELGLFGKLQSGSTLKIGRRTNADIKIDNPKVSRDHAILRLSDKELSIEDTGSENGVYVNGDRISSPQRLSRGDKIACGPVEFELGWQNA